MDIFKIVFENNITYFILFLIWHFINEILQHCNKIKWMDFG